MDIYTITYVWNDFQSDDRCESIRLQIKLQAWLVEMDKSL